VLTRKVLQGRKISPLTTGEQALLEGTISEVRSVAARTVLVRKGVELEHSTLLLKGLLSRHVDDRHGQRQFVSVHLAGDLVDIHAYPMKRLDHDVAALSDADVAIMPLTALKAITEANPELARKLWFASLLDAAMHRAWIFRLGRLDAVGRVCHFFAETGARLFAIGAAPPGRFDLHMTQVDVGEACGLTGVHVSRVLKLLREGDICTFKDGRVEILDYAAMVRRGQFDPSYLYLEIPPDVGVLNARSCSSRSGPGPP